MALIVYCQRDSEIRQNDVHRRDGGYCCELLTCLPDIPFLCTHKKNAYRFSPTLSRVRPNCSTTYFFLFSPFLINFLLLVGTMSELHSLSVLCSVSLYLLLMATISKPSIILIVLKPTQIEIGLAETLPGCKEMQHNYAFKFTFLVQ